MKKQYKIVISALIIVALGIGAFWVYGSMSINKSIKKGNELIAQKEYEKAIASFDLALDDKPNDKEALEPKSMIEKYLKAKKLFDEGNYQEANKEISEINSNYTSFDGLKNDVNSLKSKIKESLKKDEEINNNVDKVRELINKKSYDDAKKSIDELEKEKLNDSQKKQIEDLKARVTSELARIEAEKKAKEEAEKSQEKKNNYNNFSKPFMTEQEATKLINDKLGNSNLEYGFMNKEGVQATYIYYFKEYQTTPNGIVKGPNYMLDASNGKIMNQDGEVVSEAIR